MAIEEVLKYEGSNHTFIYKHPVEDFSIGTQLIVHESQEAIFFLNGQALGLFTAGRHTLETENIPFLKNLININTGGKTAFHAEVYFINKTEQMGIKWGTDAHITYMDPIYGFPLEVGASGEMSLCVENSRKLLLKMVGTENGLSQEGLIRNIKSFLMMHVKSHLANVITEEKINIFTLDSQLPILSDRLKEKISHCFQDYGVILKKFVVTTIVRPEGDITYERFKSLYFKQYADVKQAEIEQQIAIINQNTEAQKRIIEAESIARKRSIEGYTYQQERGYDVAEKVAENEAVGEFSNLGIGMGMISGISNTLGGYVSNVASQSLQNGVERNKRCSNCGQSISNNAKFCHNCGQKTDDSVCSQCSYIFQSNENFCPNCGNKR